MLNSRFFQDQAARLAQRLQEEVGNDLEKQVHRALARVTSRPPTSKEVQRALDLILALERQEGATPAQALQTFCLMALNLNEFLYLD